MITVQQRKELNSVYTVETFPYEDYAQAECVKVKGKKARTLYNLACAFDIETTSIPHYKMVKGQVIVDSAKSYGFMYHWQFAINDSVIFGRTWEEFQNLLKRLQESLLIGYANRYLVVYCHNLAFEFQFAKSFLHFNDVFARKKRQPIIARCAEGIEFRCSYYLSNMSLQKFCETTQNVSHGKVVGGLDYDKIRLPSTELTALEKIYCYNDVVGITECIRQKMIEDGDISKIPMTSTGYVRRDFRKAVQSNPRNIDRIRKSALDAKLYIMCKEAFRGGNCHANAYYADALLEDVQSMDIQSSYPYVMFAKKFPSTKFVKAEVKTIEELQAFLDEYAMLFRVTLYNVRAKKHTYIPYIPIAKCYSRKRVIADNGRILFAKEISLTITDIDWKIIKDTYDIEEISIGDCYISKYDYLPKELRQELLQYFEMKTKLKDGDKYLYNKAKNRFNASYGMMVTDIVNPNIQYDPVSDEWLEEKDVLGNNRIENEKNTSDMSLINTALYKYYRSNKSFLSYQHGIWVTAWARYRLQQGINALGKHIIYCDTDSCKYFYTKDSVTIFKELNDEVQREIAELDIKPIVYYKGKTYVCGEWEDDGHYKRFKTCGAKKYVCEYDDGHIVVTVSGLNKKKASEYIQQIGIENFKTGLVFEPKVSGRLSAVYKDVGVHKVTINGETFTSGSNVALCPVSYTLGLTDDYEFLIQLLRK